MATSPSLCEGTICENPELASRPSCVYLSTPGSLLTTQRNDIIAQYVKVLQVVYLSQDIPSELSHDIYNQKTAESTMRSDSISATGSRCSPRDLTPTGGHCCRSHHLCLHETLLSTKYCHEYITYSTCLPRGRT